MQFFKVLLFATSVFSFCATEKYKKYVDKCKSYASQGYNFTKDHTLKTVDKTSKFISKYGQICAESSKRTATKYIAKVKSLITKNNDKNAELEEPLKEEQVQEEEGLEDLLGGDNGMDGFDFAKFFKMLQEMQENGGKDQKERPQEEYVGEELESVDELPESAKEEVNVGEEVEEKEEEEVKQDL